MTVSGFTLGGRTLDAEARAVGLKSAGLYFLDRSTQPRDQKYSLPVDFSPSCIAMAPFVRRAATLLGGKVSLIHVVDLTSRNGFELYLRPAPQIADEHRKIGKERLNSFLAAEFPLSQCPRILDSGEPAMEIARAARVGGFDLIIMPTHAGFFQRMLLGSTTTKVLNDADCPVLTSRHAGTIHPHPLEHREWLCAVDLGPDSARVLRFAMQAAAQAHGCVSVIHALRGEDPNAPIQLNVVKQKHSVQEALRHSAELRALS